jgi:hypothetical protein
MNPDFPGKSLLRETREDACRPQLPSGAYVRHRFSFRQLPFGGKLSFLGVSAEFLTNDPLPGLSHVVEAATRQASQESFQ